MDTSKNKGTGGINPRTGKRRPIIVHFARTSLVKKIFEIAS